MSAWLSLAIAVIALALSVWALAAAVRNYHRITGKWW